MPAATLTAVDALERDLRRAGYAAEALRLLANRSRYMLAFCDPEAIPSHAAAAREEVIAEIADGVPGKPGETRLNAYLAAWPDVEAAVDAALGIIFPES